MFDDRKLFRYPSGICFIVVIMHGGHVVNALVTVYECAAVVVEGCSPNRWQVQIV